MDDPSDEDLLAAAGDDADAFAAVLVITREHGTRAVAPGPVVMKARPLYPAS
jgi:predicted dinucleotide-binding enzyme